MTSSSAHAEMRKNTLRNWTAVWNIAPWKPLIDSGVGLPSNTGTLKQQQLIDLPVRHKRIHHLIEGIVHVQSKHVHYR